MSDKDMIIELLGIAEVAEDGTVDFTDRAKEIIMDLAEKGPCVIVGRCADYILRERTDVLNVFIHAPISYRADRVVRLYGESDQAPEKRLEEKDKRRRAYYKHYADRDWGMSQNYHLSLDSSLVGIERCAQLILDVARNPEKAD